MLGGLLGLPAGVEVELVEREADGSFTVHVRTAAGVEACCPRWGVPAGRVKEAAGQTVAHLVVAPMAVTWHKHRFFGDSRVCDQAVFTEGGPLAVRGGTVSAAARETMGHLVGDWGVAVGVVARAARVSWHTAHRGFVALAATAGIVVTDPAVQAGAGEPAAAGGDGPASGRSAAGEARSVSGPLPAVDVPGIDDHRRGRPGYHWDPAAGRWAADVDRWQTGLFDSAGGHGLLGVVAGRTAAGTAACILGRPEAWRAGVEAVTIEMSTVYQAAARAALPHATVAVDPFGVAQLANKAVGDVRRRVTHQRRGRRGRATDPADQIRNLLLRGPGTLAKKGRDRILTTLAGLGGEEAFAIGAVWRAKNLLLGLLALSPTRTGRATTRTDTGRALTRFFDYCATVGAAVPEVVTLAETVSNWRAEIAAAVLHGLSNAAAEGVNRLIKLVYRTAFGLTNVANQQRRARYAASRSTRPHWLRPVTTHALAA